MNDRVRRFFAGRISKDTYLGLHLTIGLTVLGLAVWLFGALLDAVLDNASLVHWDMATAAWVHAQGRRRRARLFQFQNHRQRRR